MVNLDKLGYGKLERFDDWERKIIIKYPNIFTDYRVREDWGFECGSGWKDIIELTCEKISKLNYPVKILSMKEKWGTLSVHTSPYRSDKNEDLNTIIDELEEASETTCSLCGSDKGILRKDGWHEVTCNKCKFDK